MIIVNDSECCLVMIRDSKIAINNGKWWMCDAQQYVQQSFMMNDVLKHYSMMNNDF